jgi:hypothetical protein
MAGQDEEDYKFYGTPIEDEEETRAGQRRKEARDPAATRALPLHKQEATDEQGRRRFHGAFTGGFSAGYFNTGERSEGPSPPHEQPRSFAPVGGAPAAPAHRPCSRVGPARSPPPLPGSPVHPHCPARRPPPAQRLQWGPRRGGSPPASGRRGTSGPRYSRAWSSTSTTTSWRSCAGPTCRWALALRCPAAAAWRRGAPGRPGGQRSPEPLHGLRVRLSPAPSRLWLGGAGRGCGCLLSCLPATTLLPVRIALHQTTAEYDTFGSTAAELARRAAADAAAERRSGEALCAGGCWRSAACPALSLHLPCCLSPAGSPRMGAHRLPPPFPPLLACSHPQLDARRNGGARGGERGHPPAAKDGLAAGQGNRRGRRHAHRRRRGGRAGCWRRRRRRGGAAPPLGPARQRGGGEHAAAPAGAQDRPAWPGLRSLQGEQDAWRRSIASVAETCLQGPACSPAQPVGARLAAWRERWGNGPCILQHCTTTFKRAAASPSPLPLPPVRARRTFAASRSSAGRPTRRVRPPRSGGAASPLARVRRRFGGPRSRSRRPLRSAGAAPPAALTQSLPPPPPSLPLLCPWPAPVDPA